MSIFILGSAAEFSEQVAVALDLSSDWGDAEIRKALRAKGLDYLAWYNNRVRAIAESSEVPRFCNATQSGVASATN